MSALEKALNTYFAKFGESFPLCIVDCREETEIIAEIEQCVSMDTKAPQPVYKEGCDY